jgi:hypothetical protein
MTKPMDFIVNSNYATLKNVLPTITTTIDVPQTYIPVEESRWYMFTISVPKGDYIERVKISSNRVPGKIWVTNTINIIRDQSDGSELVVQVFKQQDGQYNVFVMLVNPSGSDITTPAEQLTIVINLFLSPFD